MRQSTIFKINFYVRESRPIISGASIKSIMHVSNIDRNNVRGGRT